MQIAVIAKEPRPGRVKTRLCPPFTPDQAAALAATALTDTLHAVANTPATRRVVVLDGATGPWLPDGFDVIVQRGDGLAERLDAAFTDCARTSTEPIVLVGMDTPQLTPEHLIRAGTMLAGDPSHRTPRRAVLGPAADGGYWLIGLSTVEAGLFDGVTMSAATTFAEQHGRLRANRFDVELVETLTDVDTAREAHAVAKEIPDSRFARCLRCTSSLATVA